MMLIGHSIAQRVHLMQRSSSTRNIPRNRSEGIFFCSGYWTVSFLRNRCRPVTPSPSNRSSSTSRSSHFFRAMKRPFADRRSCRFPSARRDRREPLPPAQRLSELGQQKAEHEQASEDPGERDQTGRPSRGGQDRRRDQDDVAQGDRDQPFPAKPHELVEAVAGKRRAEPDVAENEERRLPDEPEEGRDDVEKREGGDGGKGRQPPAEEERHRHA